MALVSLAPMLMFSIQGEPVRLAIADQTGTVGPRVLQNLSPENRSEKIKEALNSSDSGPKINPAQGDQMKRGAGNIGSSFALEEVKVDGRTEDQLRQELNARINQKTLDAYLIIPESFEANGANFDLYARNSGDFITKEIVERAMEEAVRSERLAKANISETQLKEVNRPVNVSMVKVSEKGEEKDSGSMVAVAFVIGILIYITLAIYGAAILQAIIEEKETRIAEILFSSAKPFELMLGKLVGVGLAGLTQIGIWTISGLVLAGYGIAMMGGAGIALSSMPVITPAFVAAFLVFFLLGFFLYATIYALIGSMVTTAQEGQQFTFPPMLILMMGFFSVFAVIRDPNSMFAFWVSVAPFTAPMVMPVRILIETPPFWQILLSVALNLLTILALVWVAARAYRVGMLMYGKRATLPEVWRWVWQK
jgi:ABC-2 type transport system permease protein